MFKAIRVIACLILFLPLTGVIASTVDITAQSPPATLIKQLKQGGYIIYMRHGPTDHNSKDIDRSDLKNCSRQRNLSSEGRLKMAKIGRIIKELHIPIGKVSSSPYCRTKDTAQLVFGSYQVDNNLQFSISKDKEESRQLGEYLKKALNHARPGNKNRVFVGHTSNLRDGLGIWPKPEGVAVIFKKEDTSLVYKGMIKPDDWFKESPIKTLKNELLEK